MTIIAKTLWGALLALAGIGLAIVPEIDPALTPDRPPITAPPTQTTPIPSTTVLGHSGAPQTPCSTAIHLLVQAGWPLAELEQAIRIVHRESRCSPDAYNPTDPNGGSYGLFQINGFWCQPSRYHPNGFLAQIGVRDCKQLFEPLTNIQAAFLIWQNSGWAPWSA